MTYHCSPKLVEACDSEYETGEFAPHGACAELYAEHAKHFRRDAAGDGRERRERERERREPPSSAHSRERFHRFVENVHLVREHNRKGDATHQITLNQFSDLYDHELPLSSTTAENFWDNLDPNDFVRLSSHDVMLHAVRDRRLKKKKWKRKRKHHHPKITVDVDPNDRWSTIDTAIDDHLEGRQVQISARKRTVGNLIRDQDSADEDTFETHLNWASSDNPDGVAIVHEPSDQGACGSCWAFAATGTLEASASRRVAYESYANFLRDAGSVEDAEDQAELVAQRAEQAAIGVASLSVQELVDCDTAMDQGCTGGNPLLAFYFIHRYGLASAVEYPYVGERDTCKVRRVADPIATAQSWGILNTNHEDNMQLVLRWIGPIAVGVHGSDPTFLAYKQGIYDNQRCDQAANHAMLVVGYGQEEDAQGNIVRYWIARNSWGKGWGEDGYVRVKRGSGAKDEPGVCGIAKNPSVALGGVLLPNSGGQSASTHDLGEFSDRSSRLEESLLTNYCEALGLGDLQTCHRIEGLIQVYPALTYGSVSMILVALFVVWPLTRECRERRRRREIRRTLQLETRNGTEAASGERAELLSTSRDQESYGTNHDGENAAWTFRCNTSLI